MKMYSGRNYWNARTLIKTISRTKRENFRLWKIIDENVYCWLLTCWWCRHEWGSEGRHIDFLPQTFDCSHDARSYFNCNPVSGHAMFPCTVYQLASRLLLVPRHHLFHNRCGKKERNERRRRKKGSIKWQSKNKHVYVFLWKNNEIFMWKW